MPTSEKKKEKVLEDSHHRHSFMYGLGCFPTTWVGLSSCKEECMVLKT